MVLVYFADINVDGDLDLPRLFLCGCCDHGINRDRAETFLPQRLSM